MVTKVIFLILFILSLVITGVLGWSLLNTGLLAPQLVIMAVGLLVLLVLLLYLLQREKKGQNKKTGVRVALIVLVLFLCILEGAAVFFLHGYNRSMDTVTEVHTQVTRVTVYVKDENRAQTIEYAVESNYVFGTLAMTDEEAVNSTQRKMESKYGRKVTLRNYSSLLDLIRALDEDEIDALLISSAYLDLIESLPDYAHYANSLRVLLESDVTTEIAPQESRINEEIDEETAEALQAPDLWENSFVAYVSGIDTYGPVGARSRSDVNILAVVNKETKTVLLISTPRDFYVPFNFVGGAMDKLTHAGIYGIEYSIQALSDYYGMPVHYYLRVNFTGFIDIIDTLGGVDVESDAEFTNGGYYFRKGMNHLDGKAALRFVRDRYSFRDGDRARGRHQMAVIKGVINGLVSFKMLSNYSEIMDQMAGSFQTNASKTLVGELVRLTLDRSQGDWTVLTYSVNGVGREDYAYSLGCRAYVMIPYTDTVDYARALAISVASGETPTQEEINENAPKH